jgi:hypothetical protein
MERGVKYIGRVKDYIERRKSKRLYRRRIGRKKEPKEKGVR